jgi:antirestriction protein ArdC
MLRPSGHQGLPSREPRPSSGTSRRQPGKAKQLVSAALDRLEQGLQAGRSEELQEYLRALGRFHRYSFHNCLLIASQFPTASRVAGFRTWKKFGRWVRKGETGIAIVVPVKVRKKDAEHEDDETIVRFRAGYVFDVTQTEGEALPAPPEAQGDPGRHLPALEAFAEEHSISIEHLSEMPPGTDGLSSGGRIRLRAGLRRAQEFHVLAHELAHELLHQTESGDRPAKVVRETEAEAVAFAVCEAAGVPVGTASSDYISLYDGTAETLRASLQRIQKAASTLIGFVLDQEEQETVLPS